MDGAGVLLASSFFILFNGRRLCPQPVLECAVQRGLVYNKVNPIFHHWRVEDRKFGLTFQSPADAISFEKGLQAVIDKLDRGISADPAVRSASKKETAAERPQNLPSPSDPGSDSPSSSTPEEADTEDDGQAVSVTFSRFLSLLSRRC